MEKRTFNVMTFKKIEKLIRSGENQSGLPTLLNTRLQKSLSSSRSALALEVSLELKLWRWVRANSSQNELS